MYVIYHFVYSILACWQHEIGAGLICDGKLAGIFSEFGYNSKVNQLTRYIYFTNVYLYKNWLEEIGLGPPLVDGDLAKLGQFRGIVWICWPNAV